MKVAKEIGIALFALLLTVPAMAQLVDYYSPSRMFGAKRTTPPVRFDPANLNLEEARRLYREVYVQATEVPHHWNPGTGCEPGSIPTEVLEARLNEINYFRRMAGLCAVRTDSSLNRNSQAAATMMRMHGTVTTNPTPDWPCYSKRAAQAASLSMMGWETKIMTFMEDFADPSAPGFRAKLLYEPLEVIGYGATDKTEVINVHGWVNDMHDSLPEFVAWPPAGYVPVEVATDRWTFKIPGSGSDYSYASVHVFLDGKEIPTEFYKTWCNDYYGLIWEVKDWYIWKEKAIGHKLLVKINHVKVGGKMQFYEYEVRFFQGIERVPETEEASLN